MQGARPLPAGGNIFILQARPETVWSEKPVTSAVETTRSATDFILAGLLSGRKIWISTAQVANRMLIIARTTPVEQVSKPTDGLSLFYTALDRSRVDAMIAVRLRITGHSRDDMIATLANGAPTVVVEETVAEDAA